MIIPIIPCTIMLIIFVGLIVAVNRLSAKAAKIGPLENFPLCIITIIYAELDLATLKSVPADMVCSLQSRGIIVYTADNLL